MGKNKLNIGNNNKIEKSNIAANNICIEEKSEKKPFLNKVLIPIIVTVIGGVITAVILIILKLNWM